MRRQQNLFGFFSVDVSQDESYINVSYLARDVRKNSATSSRINY
jgi:hypothetical protein